MKFRKYIPTKLNSLVFSIFERKVDIPLKVQFLPDNTISLIFYIGEKIESAKGKKVNSKVFNPTETFCFITGLHTESLHFDMEGLHSIGLNMHPSAIKAFWGIPVEEFQDVVTDWEMTGDLAYIEDQIRTLQTFQERALWLENYFFNKLNQVDLSLALQLNKMTRRLEQDVLMGKRPDIEAYSGYSKMHTHRLFKDWMGLTPGKLLRYKQFLRAIDLMHQSEQNLTQIGYECGFYDQSHFIRVFEEFAQMTPGKYQKNKSPLPGILLW
ncbi:MAG: helix-turn-helix domain-containing protein [Saprospiraceae bacterium]